MRWKQSSLFKEICCNQKLTSWIESFKLVCFMNLHFYLINKPFTMIILVKINKKSNKLIIVFWDASVRAELSFSARTNYESWDTANHEFRMQKYYMHLHSWVQVGYNWAKFLTSFSYKIKNPLSICALLTFSTVYLVDYTGSHSNETARWKLRRKYDIEHYASDLHLKTLRDIFRLVWEY